MRIYDLDGMFWISLWWCAPLLTHFLFLSQNRHQKFLVFFEYFVCWEHFAHFESFPVHQVLNSLSRKLLRIFQVYNTVLTAGPVFSTKWQTLISSLKQIGNIVLICCAFFIIFGILGVQLFKGKFYYCDGENLREVRTKLDCEEKGYVWKNRRYNFDHLGQALMSLFVLSSKGNDLILFG